MTRLHVRVSRSMVSADVIASVCPVSWAGLTDTSLSLIEISLDHLRPLRLWLMLSAGPRAYYSACYLHLLIFSARADPKPSPDKILGKQICQDHVPKPDIC